jgi:hypothetical protein
MVARPRNHLNLRHQIAQTSRPHRVAFPFPQVLMVAGSRNQTGKIACSASQSYHSGLLSAEQIMSLT